MNKKIVHFIVHIRRWNTWRKRSLDSKMHKLLVLFGIIKSPSMYFVLLPEEKEEIRKTIHKTLYADEVEMK